MPPSRLSNFVTQFLLVCVVILLCPSGTIHAYGQAQNTGSITGTVADPERALIPGAEVTLTSEDRGTVYTAKTNGDGEYALNGIPVGAYTLQVRASGFATFVSVHVLIDAESHVTAQAILHPGNVDEVVHVDADSLTVNTQSAEVGQIIDHELVENLPIDGNNVVALAALLPGVSDVSAPATFTSESAGPTLVANGSRSNSNLFLFDGLIWNNLYLNNPINYPNHIVLDQVTVQLNNFSAQYGRSAGSIFNIVSKSGSNNLHGEIYLSYHNSTLDASNYFSQLRPPQTTYQYGISAGGPILRNRIFLEGEFEGLVGHNAIPASAATLTPNEEGYNADGTPYMCTTPQLVGKQCASFAGDARSASLVQQLIVNPVFYTQVYSSSTGLSTTPCASGSTCPISFSTIPTTAKTQLQSTWNTLGNTTTSPCIATLQGLGAGFLANAEIPAECFDPTVQAIIKRGYIPTPTRQLGSSQYLYAAQETTQPQNAYGAYVRGDYNINPRQALTLRFYRADNTDSTSNGAASANTGVPSYEIDNNQALVTSGSIGHRAVLGASLVNVATLGYKRYEYHAIPSDPTTLSSLGASYAYPGFQSLPILNVATRFTLGNAANAYTHSVGENEELLDNLTWVIGRHNLQLGVDILHQQYLNVRVNPGNFYFSGNPGFTNAQAADFIMGLVYMTSVGNPQRISAIQNDFYQYAQDAWRVTPRLTLNVGLRYELSIPWRQPDQQSATFIPGYQSLRIPNAPAGLAFAGDPGVPKSLIQADFTNVSPRLGIAYDVFGNGKLAIRAGFGTFYDAIPATIVGLTEPYTYRASYTLPPGSITDPLLNESAIPTYTGGTNPQFTAPYSIIYPDHNFRNSYTIATNFGFQFQATKASVLEVNYIGRFSRHQMIPVDQNYTIYDCSGAYYAANPTLYCPSAPTNNYTARAHYPGFAVGGTGVVDLMSEGTANYNALQLSYNQRAYKKLTIITNYTYARSLDEQSSLSTSSSIPQPLSLASQYGPSDNNATQIFNLGWRLDMPTLSGGPRSLKAVLNGWNFNGVYNARTGHPVNLTFGGDELGNDEPNQRVYLIPGMSPTLPSNRHRSARITEWFNTSAFQKPAAFTSSNIGRNFIIGPAYINTQFSLTRSFDLHRLHKNTRVQFRAEAFNVFNTINLGQPQAQYSSSAAQATTFGSINSSGTNPNRRVQFGTVISF